MNPSSHLCSSTLFEEFELSNYQKGLWLEWKLAPLSSKYNTPLIFEIKGNLEIEALKKALFSYVNEYHTVNRHYFTEENHQIKQRILQEIECPLEIIILPENKDPKTAIDQFIETKTDFAFTLSSPPLFKFSLLKVTNTHYVLVLNFHHIVSDAFTGAFLVNTLQQLYHHYAFHSPKPNPPTPSFKDYLLRENREETIYEQEALDFWKTKLAGLPLKVRFPFFNKWGLPGNNPLDKKQDLPEDNEIGSSFTFSFDKNLTSKIKLHAKKENATIFVVLSTLFSLVLSRYSQQNTIVLSYSVNTRPAGFSETPGCFVNNVPMTFQFTPETSFNDLISTQIKERKDTKLYKSCSLTDIIHALKKETHFEGDFFNVSIIETFFNLQSPDFKDLEVTCLHRPKKRVFHDLALYYQELDSALQFRLDYRQPFEDLMVAFCDHFRSMADLILENPSIPCLSLPILQPHERKQIEAWNQTLQDFSKNEQGFPKEVSLYDLFEKQQRLTPDNVAIATQERSLSYHELHLKASLLAQRMPEAELVAISLNKSLESTIAMMACLKLNIPYMPLDPEDAPQRIETLLKDTEVTLVLTDKKHMKSLEFLEQEGRQIFVLEEEGGNKQNNVQSKILNNIQNKATKPIDLAYVLYTSGSTGLPKAVMVEQKSVINLLLDIKQKLHFSSKDRVLSLTSPSFDIYALELFLPLISGASHFIAPKDCTKDPAQFIKLVKRVSPSFIQATPSFWSMMVPYLKKEHGPFTLFCGGENLKQALKEKLLSISSEVWNVYGPTETTIWSSFSRCQKDSPVTIGRGFANTKLHVLDPFLNEVPIGVIGELYISGEGLARGYLKNDSLTQEKFIFKEETSHPLSPMSSLPPLRLYQTGDFARWTLTGELEYIGRKDSQIKLRGHRIEIEEIEEALFTYPGILNACVKLISEEDHEQLVAYYTLKKPAFIDKLFRNTFEPNVEAFTQHLKKKLPQIMLPSCFIKLDHMPVNQNGKIDKSKLPPPPKEGFLEKTGQSLQPLDMIELQLKMFWKKILKLEEFSLNDDFFRLGGNSLSGVFLLSQIQKKFKVQYTVTWLLQNPTIQAQAEKLRLEKNAAIHYEPLIHFNRSEMHHPPIFFIHPGLAGAEVYSELASHFDKHIPLYALDSYNLNSGKPFLKRIEELAFRYLEEIKALYPEGPYFLAGWSLGGIIAFEMAQQLQKRAKEKGFRDFPDHPVSKLYFLDSQIYTEDYLHHVAKNISVDILIRELPDNRGKYISKLPQNYLNRVLLSLKNDVQLLINYRYKPYPGKALLFKTVKETRLNLGLFENKFNGWKPFISNLEVINLHANHINLLEGETGKQIAKKIQESMEAEMGSRDL